MESLRLQPARLITIFLRLITELETSLTTVEFPTLGGRGGHSYARSSQARSAADVQTGGSQPGGAFARAAKSFDRAAEMLTQHGFVDPKTAKPYTGAAVKGWFYTSGQTFGSLNCAR